MLCWCIISVDMMKFVLFWWMFLGVGLVLSVRLVIVSIWCIINCSWVVVWWVCMVLVM